jgi:cytochrome c biogenesis protein CcmG/thiol:disulfide interchange protein DsbE
MSSPSARTRQRQRSRPQTPPTPSNRRPVVIIAVIAAVVVAALVAALVVGGGDDGDGDTTTGGSGAEGDAGASLDDAAVTVTGDALSPLPEGGGDDPAIGTPMPTLSGTALDGTSLTIPTTGRPTLIVFLAHWCPHCQAEVPVVQDWVDGGGLPAGVDLVSVSTAIDPRRPNYPPGEWLEREGWTAPVLVDGQDQAAAAAGLTAFPFFVAVDGEGNVVARESGELTDSQLTEVATLLAE